MEFKDNNVSALIREIKYIQRKLTCPLEPYAEYNKVPFSTLPPHLLIAEAIKVDLTALCAASSKKNVSDKICQLGAKIN